MTQAAIQTAKRAPGWWYPWIFVGCMGIVVAVNSVLVYFALSSWTGLETRDHYGKGLVYNENLAAQRAQEARGWQVALTVGAGTADRTFPVTVSFVDAQGAALTNVTGRLVARRPTHEGFDAEADLVDQGKGRYGAPLELGLPGQWDVRIIAQADEAAFQRVDRITVP